MTLELKEFSRAEVLQYLQWRGSEIPPEVAGQIDGCIAETLSLAQPRVVWRLFAVDAVPEGILLGEDIRALLADCEQCVLFAATLGNPLENAIRRAQVRDMTRAIILDCCGSAAIEAVCDMAEQEIQTALGEKTYFTDRFSPGYGDLPISVQPRFLETLNAARQIGLTLTPTGIMTPRKSVSAVIGLADKPQTKRFRGCAYCSMFENCTFRKAGKTCGRA